MVYPVRRLKWHVRSRHGSLIAFSNKHFYNSEWVVFPSCDRDFAIHRHLVSDASYTKSVNLACDKALLVLPLAIGVGAAVATQTTWVLAVAGSEMVLAHGS